MPWCRHYLSQRSFRYSCSIFTAYLVCVYIYIYIYKHIYMYTPETTIFAINIWDMVCCLSRKHKWWVMTPGGHYLDYYRQRQRFSGTDFVNWMIGSQRIILVTTARAAHPDYFGYEIKLPEILLKKTGDIKKIETLDGNIQTFFHYMTRNVIKGRKGTRGNFDMITSIWSIAVMVLLKRQARNMSMLHYR